MGVKTVALSQQHLSTFLWENELYSPKQAVQKETLDQRPGTQRLDGG